MSQIKAQSLFAHLGLPCFASVPGACEGRCTPGLCPELQFPTNQPASRTLNLSPSLPRISLLLPDIPPHPGICLIQALPEAPHLFPQVLPQGPSCSPLPLSLFLCLLASPLRPCQLMFSPGICIMVSLLRRLVIVFFAIY